MTNEPEQTDLFFPPVASCSGRNPATVAPVSAENNGPTVAAVDWFAPFESSQRSFSEMLEWFRAFNEAACNLIAWKGRAA